MNHFIEKVSGVQRKVILAAVDGCILFSSIKLMLHVFGINHYSYNILFGVMLIKIAVFYELKLYEFMWRYASVKALLSTVIGVSASTLLLLGINWALKPQVIYYNFLIVDWAFTLILIGGLRFSLRVWREYLHSRNQLGSGETKVIIIGAGDAGEIVAREIKKTSSGEYDVVGFVDDKRSKKGKAIHGKPVLGSIAELPELAKKYNITQAIIAIPSATGDQVRHITELCEKANITFKITPGLFEVIERGIAVNQLREVQIEDLLGRQVVETDLGSINNFHGKTVLVTGSGGSIGSELARQMMRLNPQTLILLDNNEFAMYEIDMELKQLSLQFQNVKFYSVIADVKNKNRLTDIFATYKPHIVFHAAAYKHVPLMEQNIQEVVYNNVLGTKNVIDLAHEFQAEEFVLISTDKAVYPANAMGASKRLCELLMQIQSSNSKTTFTAVRFGNVLGSKGSVVPLFKKQILEGGPITITHPEMTRYFMTIPEAVRLVIQAGLLAKGGEIFILDMGEPVKILSMAKDMIRLSGLKEGKDIKIEFTGLRPGEKLAEELFFDKEQLEKTPNSKILITKPFEYDQNEIKAKIDALIQMAHSQSDAELFQSIMTIISVSQPKQTIEAV